MKKKKRNFITKIFSLLLLGIISVTLLGSWTYDNNGNLVSDNLIKINDTSISGSNYVFNNMIISLNQGEYTFSFNFNGSQADAQLQIYDNNGASQFDEVFYVINGLNTRTFTISTNASRMTLYSNAIGSYTNFMTNTGSTALPYDPYGTWYSQENYDSLYEDYESWRNDYQELSQQYDELEQNFNELQQNYNILQTNYNNAIDDLDELRDEKQELQLQIANLNSQIRSLQDEIANLKLQNKDLYNSLYGYNYFSNSNNSIIQTYSNDFYNNIIGSGSNLYHTWYLNSFNINDFIVDNRLSAYSLANAIYQDNKNGSSSGGTVTPWGNNLFTSLTLYPSYRVGSSVTSNYYYAKDFNIAIHYDILSNVNVRILLAQNTTDITNLNFSFVRYDLDDIVDNSINVSFTETSTLYNYLVVAVEIQYTFDSNTDNYNGADYIYSNGLTGEANTAYKLGYDTGYGTASSIYSENIYNLNTEINSLNSTISYLRNEISDLQERLANNLGWRPLFFAMADTPIEVVSKVLGFELFGINLFQAFIGIITALAIIWLIRKIWK